MKEKILYHYTSTFHLPMILKSRYLKLTCSNLIEPQSSGILELMASSYKSVVWMTDKLMVDNGFSNGLDGCAVDKTEVRITIKNTNKCKWWKSWSRNNKINRSWAKDLEQGRNASSLVGK